MTARATGLRPGLGLLLATLVALAASGCASAPSGTVNVDEAPSRTAGSAGSAGSTGSTRSSEAPDAGAPVPGPGDLPARDPGGERPVALEVPDLGLEAETIDLGIRADGTIEVPDDPDDVGWLDTTPAPGRQGPAVLAGHVDSATGPAVFADLATLQEGATVVVRREDGSSARFTVDGVRTYPQDDFPTADVYGPVPGPALRLITCGGDYDPEQGGYQDNVVVYAS